MKVHILIQRRSEDYHGSYDEIVNVYSDPDIANAEAEKLNEDEHSCNIEYFVNSYNVM